MEVRWRELFGRSEKERYEYRCPACGYLNIRYEKTMRIVCDRCGRVFYGW